jgi:hypothetical protein
LRLDIIGLAAGELLPARQILPVGDERLGGLAQRDQDIADLVGAECEVGLPLGIARVGIDELRLIASPVALERLLALATTTARALPTARSSPKTRLTALQARGRPAFSGRAIYERRGLRRVAEPIRMSPRRSQAA